MKKAVAVAAAVVITALLGTAFAAGSVVVYSPHDEKPLNAAVDMFNEIYPDIKVEIVTATTGELLARIKAETENPLSDVLWGCGADSVAAFADCFEPYVCANDGVISEIFKDGSDRWIGESPLPMVLFYNRNMVSDEEAPKTWQDLLDTKWKGKIAFASPTKSGSAFTQLCTMLFANGGNDGGGWDYIEKFYANLDGKLLESSGYCHKLVRSGEYAIGVTLEKAAVLYRGDESVGFVYPPQNSAVPDAIALVKGARNSENGKLFIDFLTGYDCQREQNVDWKRRPARSDIQPEGLVPIEDIDLCEYDFDWVANNKEAVLEKWQDMVIG